MLFHLVNLVSPGNQPIFKVSIECKIDNHGLVNTYKPEQIERMYHYSTSLPLCFLTIDLKTLDESKRLRSGFSSFFLNFFRSV